MQRHEGTSVVKVRGALPAAFVPRGHTVSARDEKEALDDYRARSHLNADPAAEWLMGLPQVLSHPSCASAASTSAFSLQGGAVALPGAGGGMAGPDGWPSPRTPRLPGLAPLAVAPAF